MSAELHAKHEPWSVALDRLEQLSKSQSIALQQFSCETAPPYECNSLGALRELLARHRSVDLHWAKLTLAIGGKQCEVNYNVTHVDCARLTVSSFQNLGQERDTLLGALDTCFDLQPRHQLASDGLPQNVKSQVDTYQGAINELLGSVAKVETLHAEQTRRLQEFWDQKHVDLEQREEQRTAKHLEKVEADRLALQEERDELERERSQFQLKESRGVRRKLLIKLRAVLKHQKDFRSSKTLAVRSSVLFLACLLSVSIGIWLVWYALFASVQTEGTAGTASLPTSGTAAVGNVETEPSTAHTIRLYVPLASGTLMIGSTLVFLLRWLHSNAKQQAAFDYQNARFHRDILRASWVAELLFEADNLAQDGRQPVRFPDAMIEHFCQDLFKEESSNEAIHPLDDLQQYARKFKRFSIGAKGIDVEARHDDT